MAVCSLPICCPAFLSNIEFKLLSVLQNWELRFAIECLYLFNPKVQAVLTFISFETWSPHGQFCQMVQCCLNHVRGKNLSLVVQVVKWVFWTQWDFVTLSLSLTCPYTEYKWCKEGKQFLLLNFKTVHQR